MERSFDENVECFKPSFENTLPLCFLIDKSKIIFFFWRGKGDPLLCLTSMKIFVKFYKMYNVPELTSMSKKPKIREIIEKYANANYAWPRKFRSCKPTQTQQ